MKTRFELTVLQPQITSCTENWDEMLAHEKGAFCVSCNKVVHDLQNLDGDQLAAFLIKNENKSMCGKVNAALINKPVVLLWKQPEKYSLNFLFAITLIFVFGATLFSCNEKEYSIIKSTIENTFMEDLKIDRSTTVEEQEKIVRYITCDCNFAEEEILNSEKEIIDSSISYLDEIEISIPHSTREEMFTVGKLVSFVRTIKYVELDTSAVEPEIIESNKQLPLIVYPNPARDFLRIDYEINSAGLVMLSVFSTNGQKIKDIISSNDIQPGKYSETLNVSEIPAGMYLVILINDENKEVFKLNVVH